MDFIPEKFRYLLSEETKAIAYLATSMADHSPQVTPVWFTVDGPHILINSVEGRVKDRNIRRDPRVALVIADPNNIYRYVQLRGRVIEISEDESLIHRLSEIYTGNPKFKIKPGDVRVSYRILPERSTNYDW